MATAVTLRPEVLALKTLEEEYKFPGRDDASQIAVSELPGLTEKQFNTLRNQETREVTISGVTLRWDGSLAKLEAFSLTRDVTRFTLIADEIRIEEPLLWKGADVEIYARSLVFRGKGRIETTPEAFGAEAFATKRDDAGQPLNEKGEIRGANGRDGEKGGDIRLHIMALDSGGNGEVRLVTDGSNGQRGEKGGLLPFKPRPGGPPTKGVEPVTLAQIKAIIRDASYSTPDLNKLSVCTSRPTAGASRP